MNSNNDVLDKNKADDILIRNAEMSVLTTMGTAQAKSYVICVLDMSKLSENA